MARLTHQEHAYDGYGADSARNAKVPAFRNNGRRSVEKSGAQPMRAIIGYKLGQQHGFNTALPLRTQVENALFYGHAFDRVRRT